MPVWRDERNPGRSDIYASLWAIDGVGPSISAPNDNLPADAKKLDPAGGDLTDIEAGIEDVGGFLDSGLDASHVIFEARPPLRSHAASVFDTLQMTLMDQLASPKIYQATLPMPAVPGTEVRWYIRSMDNAQNMQFEPDPPQHILNPPVIKVSNLGDAVTDGCIYESDYLLVDQIVNTPFEPGLDDSLFADINEDFRLDQADLDMLRWMLDNDQTGNPGWCPLPRRPDAIVLELGVGWGAPGTQAMELPVYLENDSTIVKSLFLRTQADTARLSITGFALTPRSAQHAARFFDRDSLSYLGPRHAEVLLAGLGGASIDSGSGEVLKLLGDLPGSIPQGYYHVEMVRSAMIDTSLDRLDMLPLRGKYFVPAPPPVSIVCTPVADTLLSPGDTLTFNTTLTNHSDSTKSPKFFIYGTTAGPDSFTFLAVDTTQILQLAPGGRKRDMTDLEVPSNAPAGHYVFTAYVSDAVSILDEDPFGFQVDSTYSKPGYGGNELASSGGDMKPWRVLRGWFGYGERSGESPDSGALSPGLPKAFAITQNYPNPFNPSTTIAYDIPEGSVAVPVRIAVYDIRGRWVKNLVDEERPPGSYRVHWDGRDDRGEPVGSGVYLYRIQAGDYRSTRKMVVVR